MDKKKIIIDCDPGYDDAVAILLAAGSPEIDLMAITTVAGNQTIEKVTKNGTAFAATSTANPVLTARRCLRPNTKSIRGMPRS